MKFGFEVEYFITKDDQPVLVPSNLPYDECGWLVEVRSEPHHDIDKAIALLAVDELKVLKDAQKFDVVLLLQPLFNIPRDLKVQARRRYAKGELHYSNIYGFENHRTSLATASLHISVSNEQAHYYTGKNGKEEKFTYAGFIDYAKFVRTFDLAFKDEIKKAGRRPGFYEVKIDGRIEYRSLPNNVDREKVAKVLKEVF